MFVKTYRTYPESILSRPLGLDPPSLELKEASRGVTSEGPAHSAGQARNFVVEALYSRDKGKKEVSNATNASSAEINTIT